MSAPIYHEGPLAHWTAISFPGGFYVSLWADLAPLDSIGIIAPYPPGRTITASTALKGVIEGVDSGAQIDATLVPADVGAMSSTAATWPGCTRTITNGYSLAGTPVTAPPGRAYNLSTTGLTVIALGSFTDTGLFCSPNLDALGLGASFIQGERVTVTLP